MSAYTPSNSHDPKTDHRSIIILVSLALAVVIAIAGGTALRSKSEEPTKLYSVDGCDLYRFVDKRETGHFVRCDNGKASTSVKGKHIVTEPKPVASR